MGKFLEPTIWNSVISPSFHPGIKSYELMVGWPKSSSGFSITSYSKIKWTFLANPISVHILRGSKHFFAFLFFTVQSLKIMLVECFTVSISVFLYYFLLFIFFFFCFLLLIFYGKIVLCQLVLRLNPLQQRNLGWGYGTHDYRLSLSFL